MAVHVRHGVRMDVTPSPFGSKIRLQGAIHESFHFYASDPKEAKSNLLREASFYVDYPEVKKALEELAEVFG